MPNEKLRETNIIFSDRENPVIKLEGEEFRNMDKGRALLLRIAAIVSVALLIPSLGCVWTDESGTHYFDYELDALWTLTSIDKASGATLLPQTTYRLDMRILFSALVGGLEPPFPLETTIGCNNALGFYAPRRSGAISIWLGNLTLQACNPAPLLASDYTDGLESGFGYDARGAVLEIDSSDGASVDRLKFIDESRLPAGSRELSYGDAGFFTTEGFLALHTQADFDEAWSAHCPPGLCFQPKPSVDFSSSSVIALFIGEQPHSGCFVYLEEFIPPDGVANGTVFVRSGCAKKTITLPALTYPHQLVMTPKFTGATDFVVNVMPI